MCGAQDAGDAAIFSDTSSLDGARNDEFDRAVAALADDSGSTLSQLRNVMVDPNFEPVYEYVGESMRPCIECSIRGTSFGESRDIGVKLARKLA
jgi:hypothetical protein